MRTFIVAVVGVLAITQNYAAGDASDTTAKKSPVVKSTNAKAEEPIREFGPSDFAKGYVVAVDEKTNSFDLRASDGLIRGRNPESIHIMDRFGAPLTSMTLSKLQERHYFVTVRTGAPEPSGSFKFFINVEALP